LNIIADLPLPIVELYSGITDPSKNSLPRVV